MSKTWNLVKSESFTMTRVKALEFAAKHAGLPKSPVEREVDPSRVKRLVGILCGDLVLPFNWAVVEYDGQTVRMNGQHSSIAIKEVGPDLPDQLAFHFDRYKAEDRNGMVDLFRQFDQRWSSRTIQDISGAFQGLVPEIADCNKKVTMQTARALSWCLRTVEGLEEVPTGDNTYELLHKGDYVPFILWANGIVNSRKELLRVPVLAAMYKTHETSQSGATKFWREVSFGPDYFTDDMAPGAVLIGELNRALEEKEFKAKEFPNDAIYFKKCVKAWNAFCAGQRIGSLKVGKEKGWPEVANFRSDEEVA